MVQRLFQRWGEHYIVVMMIITRVFGTVGGLLVIYYTELTLDLPDQIRMHFRIASVAVVIVACTATVLLALWETRTLRRVLKRIRVGGQPEDQEEIAAGREAFSFVSRHHQHEAWLVPCTTLVPVLILLKLLDNASVTVMLNITLAVFMGISMALMSTFFVVEHFMQPVIRCLLDQGIPINYESLPAGRLQFRFRLCFTLIILTTAIMIGTLAQQRAADIISHPENQLQAVRVLQTHSGYITVAAVLTGLVYSGLLASSVAGRADRLVQAMDRVREGNLSERVRPTGNDEIDRLARQFNHMVGALEHHDRTIRDLNVNLERKVAQRTSELEQTVQALRDAQRKLTDLAHHAGMAEVATGVLHNVGNVLNSVNISSTILSDRIRKSKLEDLTRLTLRVPQSPAEIHAFLRDEARGEKLVEYLRKISSRLNDERTELLGELDLLIERVGHIREIITAQQDNARGGAFREYIDLRELVENALKMYGPSCEARDIQVITEYADIPQAFLEKGKFAPVLDNVIKNAIEAMEAQECARRVLTIRIHLADSQSARITVTDTGCGIRPEHLENLFNYGFTTKARGNGFGLHASALAMSAIGGTIDVHSDGPGQGTSFILDVPLHTDHGQSESKARSSPSCPTLVES